MTDDQETAKKVAPMQRRRRRVLKSHYRQDIETQEAAKEVPIPEAPEEQLKYVSRVLSVVNDIHLLFEGIWSQFEREILMIRELGGDIVKPEQILREFQENYLQHNYQGALECAHDMDQAISFAKKEYFQNGAPLILSSIKRSMVTYKQINIDVKPIDELYSQAVDAINQDKWRTAQSIIDDINRMFLRIEMQVDFVEDPSTIDVTEGLPSEMSTFEEEGFQKMLEKLDDSVNALPLDFEHTVVVLAKIKERVRMAKESGLDVEKAKKYFEEAEPQLRSDKYLKALILAKRANDALLELESAAKKDEE